MRVNCNISAVIANTKLAKSQSSLDKALERLSSGLKINSAEDDAAGLAIANKLHTQIKGLEQSKRNSSDGISVVQTAESALAETENILQRMRELAVQAASDSNSRDDRRAIQVEINQLKDEVDRISSATEFNTMPLLDGTLSRRCYADVDDVFVNTITTAVASGEYNFIVTQDARQASATVTFTPGVITETGTITINGASMTVDPNDTVNTFMVKFSDLCDAAGLGYDGTMGATLSGTITTFEYGFSQHIEYSISGSLAGAFSIPSGSVSPGRDVGIELIPGTAGEGFTNKAVVTCDGRYATVTDFGGFEMVIEVAEGVVAANGGPVTVKENVTNIGTMTVQLGANEGQVLEVDIPNVSIHTLGLDYINICTREAASKAIDDLDSAISRISYVRSTLGAYQNRLESVVAHLDAYRQDATAAVSAIEDADMADEMTEYTQHNVISQAATSMLAQANERPQSVLQLLQ